MKQEDRTKLIKEIYHVDDKNVFGFFKEHRFLSNFHEAGIMYEGIHYNSTECAYQAAKTHNREIKLKIATMIPSKAKSEGQLIQKIPNWESIKTDIMFEVNKIKYDSHLELSEQLKGTGERYLEETNYWGDKFWGTDMKHVGNNVLGLILMEIRANWLT